MNARTARWIAWFLVAIYFLLAGTGLFLGVLTDTSVGDFPIGLFVLLFTVIVIWPMIGARIVTHPSRHPVGWLLLGSFPLAAIDIFTIGFASYATLHSRGSSSIPGAVLIWLNWSAQPFVLVAFTLLNLLFPTGRLLSPRWRIVAWMCAGALPVYLTLQFLKPGSLALLPNLVNPYAVSESVWAALTPFHVFSVTLLVFCGLASVHSVFRRLRRSRGDERQQIKWLVVPAVLYWLSQPFAFLAEYEPSGVFLALGVILVLISVPLMVIAISFAIFKYRLYDIDLIINRTLVYGALTACVVGLYVLIVGGASLVIQSDNQLAALLITGVLGGVIFRPMRAYFQRRVDCLMFGEAGVPPAPPEAVRPVQEVSTTPPADEDVHSPAHWRPVARWIAWFLVFAYVILATIGLSLQGLTRLPFGAAALPVAVILVGLVGVWIVTGALIISRHPRHPVGWLLCVGLFSPALDMFSAGYAAYAAYGHVDSVPGVTLALVWLKLANLAPLGLVAFTLIVLLFPDGKFLSPGWCKVAWMTVGTLCLFLPLQAIEPDPVSFGFLPLGANPLAVSPTLWVYLLPLMWTAFYILVLCFGAGIASLIARLRKSSGDVRQQVKWLLPPVGLYGIFLLLFLIGLAEADDGIVGLSIAVGQLAVAGIVIAIAFAIFRYRLYDVDVIINRTLVYGALTACVIGLYVLVVGGLGTFVQAQGNLIIALLATGLVAVLFQPLRERLQRGVNRLLYGERDNPLALMTSLTRQLEAARDPEAMLSDLVRIVAQALKLPFAAIATGNVTQGNLLASWGKSGAETEAFPLIYQAETVGCLLVAPRTPGEKFDAAEQRLLKTIAGQAGALVQAARLTDNLRQSRMRIVSAREEERRRLRRDLHDGLGASLAALHLQTGVLKRMISQDAEAAEGVVSEFRDELGAAIDDIRRVVYALRPPALDELGLVAAIRAQAARCAHPSTDGSAFEIREPALRVWVVAPRELPPLPAAVEVAAYRIVQEALTNVLHHAQASQCTVRLCLHDGLQIEVVDDGVGIADRHPSGLGLVSMRERAAELGGVCVVERAPGGGTRVIARLPLPQE
ncbi:MAG: sensor histidine kinase [Anaerolineales bacterium]|nr:sensor histidine kinase [Anaerolineales bacterium]